MNNEELIAEGRRKVRVGCASNLEAEMTVALERLTETPLATGAAAGESDDTIMDAWGIIANAGGGDWTTQTPEWQAAAARWRDYALRGPSERAAIRALPAPEAVKAWCGHFRTCVAYSDKEDIWPEVDFKLLAYFEKEYPDA